MSSHTEAESFLADVNSKMRPLAELAHGVFVEQGCASYVKTIYVGYDIGGEMVAAMYSRSDHLEVALALPEDADGALLVDASHLTWRTLPVAAILSSDADLKEFASLVAGAVARVSEQKHDVKRDNDFFMKSRRERRANRL
jgi:hypothetical protein